MPSSGRRGAAAVGPPASHVTGLNTRARKTFGVKIVLPLNLGLVQRRGNSSLAVKMWARYLNVFSTYSNDGVPREQARLVHCTRRRADRRGSRHTRASWKPSTDRHHASG